ncbi:MAG TPA: hypothetical protein PKL30_25265 [Leptospiraceae bacterium]|nr:hypothetical protein [Leptospiraceae bacterium]HNC59878.1 hypothetical protein [Leptospiraceae bacterium]HNE11185.1 hypothetical protein [Leptospiraceae bacterium]HNH03011.1 hypothetical protein [Leptospiraceae bacterium]HNH57583.1 hypothetical protein [Leptospiraceae bacterium]
MKELITLEGDLENYDMQIVSLEGNFIPYPDSLNGDSDTLEGDLHVDKAIVEIPLNGKIYTYELELDGGFKLGKVKAPRMPRMPRMPRVRVNTRGLSRSVSRAGQGLSKAATSAGRAYGNFVNNNIKQIGQIAQGAGSLLSNVAQGAGSLLSNFGNSDSGEDQPDETEQTEESFQDDEGIENLPNEENEELNGLLSTIGSAAGSFLMPGVGTAAGGMIGNMLEQGQKKPVKKAKQIKRRKITQKDTARLSNIRARQTSINPQNQNVNRASQLNQNISYSQPQQPQRQIALKSYPDGTFSLAPKVRKAEEITDANPTGNADNPPTSDPIAPTTDPNNPPAKKKDDNTMLIIGGVAVAGFLMFSMNKKGRK